MATIPSILAGRIFGTAGATQAYYLGGGTTLSQIGPDVAAALNTQPLANASFGNGPVIKFRGTRFCQDGSTSAFLRIRRYNAYSNTWEPVFNSATPSVSTTLLSPLCAFQESNGVSGIFCVVWTAPTTVSIVKTTDGVIWTATALGAVTSTINLGRSHMHRNKLVVTGTVSGNTFATFIFDPVGLTFSTTAPPSDGTTTLSVGIGCVPAITTFNNRLFMLFTRDSTPTYSVALASNGVNVNTFVGAQTLNLNQVTTGLPTSGTFNVNTGSGYQVVTYTGLGGTSLTGCSSTGAGVLVTNGLAWSGNLAAAQLYELVGGVWTSIVAVGTNSGATAITNVTPGSHALLPIGSTKLVAIIKTDFPNVGGILAAGTRAYDLTPSGASFTSVEVTSTLIPAALRTQGGGATVDQRWSCFVDDVTVPGTPAVFVFLWGDDQAIGSISYYEYVNSTTILAPGSLGPSANVLLPYCTYGGGAYVAADSDLDVWLTSTSPVLAGTRLGYLASGLFTVASVRNSVHYATTGILPGTVTPAGAGPGHTMTGSTVALTVDGVTGFTTALHAGFRFLVKNQVATEYNGIYVLTSSAGVAWVLTRATDFDTTAKVYHGASVRVGGGNTLAGTRWMSTASPAIVDTNTISFAQITTDSGLLSRASCRLATTAALPACTAAGSGVGKTLTANAVGVLPVDSTNAVFGDRIVVKNQAATLDNGLYEVTTEGTVGVAFVLTRATDFDAVGQDEIISGAYVYVTGGVTNIDLFFEMTTDGQLFPDSSTALVFTSRMPVSWKMFFNTSENTDMSQGTLFGTATGGPSLRNVNQVDRIPADGVEPSTADWRAGTGGDGLQSGQAVTAFQRLSV